MKTERFIVENVTFREHGKVKTRPSVVDLKERQFAPFYVKESCEDVISKAKKDEDILWYLFLPLPKSFGTKPAKRPAKPKLASKLTNRKKTK